MEILLKLLSNKYFQILIAIVVAVTSGYYKGYTDRDYKAEVDDLKEFKAISLKLDKVYEYSQNQATNAQNSSIVVSSKLDTILNNTKKKTLSSVPCEPTPDFSKAWRDMDEAISNTK